MKIVMFIMVLLGVTSADAQKTYSKRLTKDEKKFVNCVLKYEKEKVISVVKRKDSHIVLEFPSTMYVLNPSGYVDDVWILEDGDWTHLGKESD
jgi:hypothetical protein